MPNRRQAIILTNDGLSYWCIYASLGLDELMLVSWVLEVGGVDCSRTCCWKGGRSEQACVSADYLIPTMERGLGSGKLGMQPKTGHRGHVYIPTDTHRNLDLIIWQYCCHHVCRTSHQFDVIMVVLQCWLLPRINGASHQLQVNISFHNLFI